MLSLNFSHSQDLIKPGPFLKSSLSLINGQTLVTDLAGLYNDARDIPRALRVEELLMKLGKEDTTDVCLNAFQRQAVTQALTQSLSLIQVLYCVNTHLVH